MNAQRILFSNHSFAMTTQVAEYIKQCKTPEEIRKRFNIKNDFTPEEEEEVQLSHHATRTHRTPSRPKSRTNKLANVACNGFGSRLALHIAYDSIRPLLP